MDEVNGVSSGPVGEVTVPVEAPVAFSTYARSLRGTADEVLTRLLTASHGNEKHTRAEWRGLLAAALQRPVHREG